MNSTPGNQAVKSKDLFHDQPISVKLPDNNTHSISAFHLPMGVRECHPVGSVHFRSAALAQFSNFFERGNYQLDMVFRRVEKGVEILVVERFRFLRIED